MKSINILIADDESYYTDILASRLSDTGWRLFTAQSGEEALKIMEAEHIDVLASDFLFLEKEGALAENGEPPMNGAQLVNAAVALQPDLYSIIFTGWKERDFAVQSLRAGVSEFIDKSQHIDSELHNAIRRGIQTITIDRLGRKLLEFQRESEIFDFLIERLIGMREFDGCCLAVLGRQSTGDGDVADVCRVERAVDLKTGDELQAGDLDQRDSAYRYVIENESVYLPPLFAPADRTLQPFFPTSRSIAVVPLRLRSERGAIGIEHNEPNRLGVENVRFLNHIAQWISLAFERLQQQRDRLRLEREIAEDLKGHFARAALHETKNPLNNLVTLLQVAAADLPDKTRTALLENVTRINTALNRNFKRFIRRGEIVREPINVPQLVRDAVSRFEEQTPPGVITIEEQVPPAVPMIVGNKSLLVSAIVNLLDNGATAAAHAASPRLRIRADYVAGRERVEIVVTDNGPGIASEDIDRIFDYAFTTYDDDSHTGYGLAFVKDVMEISGGQVTVDSDHDRGTTFKLSFAADQSPAGRDEARSEVQP